MSNPEPTLSEYIIRLRHWVDTSEKSLSCLLWLSGAFGLILGSNGAFGILGESWEAAISTAQVLNGLVRFPAGSLGYDYHASVFSITNYIACLFLAITDSETASSVLLSALLGLMAFTVTFYLHSVHTQCFSRHTDCNPPGHNQLSRRRHSLSNHLRRHWPHLCQSRTGICTLRGTFDRPLQVSPRLFSLRTCAELTSQLGTLAQCMPDIDLVHPIQKLPSHIHA